MKEVILKLPELFGSVSHLDYVSGKITNARALGAIGRLKALYALLCEYGFEEYITFDLGMLSKFDYYTGIIFRAYTFGTGDAVASGGRYEGRRVELLLMDCGADQNDYVLYAGRMHLKTVLFISGTGEITEVNP